VQRVHDVTAVVPEQSPPPVVVVRVAGVAEVGDRLVNACGIFPRDDVRFTERHGDHTAGAQAVTPVESQIRLVGDGVEAAACRHGDMTWLQATWDAHVTKLHVIAGSAVAVDASAEFLTTRARLHDTATHFAVSDLADA
jgi:hypothetical protein